MKRILLIAILVIANVAGASSTFEIYRDHEWNVDGPYKNFQYGVNAELGRAWVEFTFEDATCHDSECDRYAKGYAMVKGMYFDRSTENVMVQKDGKETVCATTMIRRTWYGGSVRVVKPTGNCTYSTQVIRGYYDNGRTRRLRNKFVLFMTLK